MPRSPSFLALCTLVAYATVLAVPCLQAPPLPGGAPAPVHAEDSAPADPHASDGHPQAHGQEHEPAQAHGNAPGHEHAQAHGHMRPDTPPRTEAHAAHGHDSHDAHEGEMNAEMGEGADHGPSPCEISGVCPCGCDRVPKATSSTTRLPWGIAAAVPVVPRAPVRALESDGLQALPGAPSGSIDHVPISA